MKLIIFPLGCLILLSILSMTGLGDELLGTMYVGGNPANAVYYDSAGRSIVYVANLTAVDPAEYIRIEKLPGFPWAGGDLAVFTNSTAAVYTVYRLYFDNGAAYQVEYGRLGQTYGGSALQNVDYSTSLGLIALVIAIMIMAAFVGLRILGSGVSEFSVGTMILGTSYMAIWGVFSVLANSLILGSGEFIVMILYFILTAIYCVGVIMQIGGTGND